MRRRLREGRQAFVVCPLVSESEKVARQSRRGRGGAAAGGELRDFRGRVLHGQMRPEEKAEAMRAFAAGETDVLVATTVIEVGIDVARPSSRATCCCASVRPVKVTIVAVVE